MKYSKDIIHFSNQLVFHYAKFDNLSDCYTLSLSDIADFDLHEFAALIMQSDISHASEATGPDNPSYETKMLPALINFLSKSYDKDEKIEFLCAWKEGITSYFSNTMEELLWESLEEYNNEYVCCNKYESTYINDSDKENNIWIA